jgi:hypothetical protein
MRGHGLKGWWRPESGIFLALWLLLLVGGRSRFYQDPGTFWHTVVGEQMLTTQRLIYHDTFSFTFAGRPWSPHQWLGECVMAVLHRVDGLDTLLWASATALAGLYTWLAHRLIRAGLHWSIAAVAVALAVAAGSSHFHVRPHLATIVGMAVTLGFLIDQESGRASPRRMGWLVPVYLLWTNLHGGMMGGLATMGLGLAGWCAYRLTRLPSPVAGFRQALSYGAVILCCALTILVNPYGLGMPRIWRTIMAGDLPQIIVEHAPLDPSRPDGWAVLVFGGAYLLVLAGTLPRWPRVTWLLPLVWFCLTCTRIRHAPLFAVAGTLAAADMLPFNRWARHLARTGSDLFRPPGSTDPRLGWRPALVPAAFVVAALALQAGRVPAPVIGHGWARLDPAYWPVQLLPSLERNQGRSSGGVPIFNEYLFGGFLIYHAPGFRVFVDDRCELYGDRWLHDYVRAEGDPGPFVRGCEEAYRPFDLALTQTGSGFDRFFGSSSDWAVVARTEAATLYQRRDSAGGAGPSLASSGRGGE